MKKLLSILLFMQVSLASPAQYARLGDLNHDNQVNITDIIALVDIVLNGYSPFSVYPTEVNLSVGGSTTVSIAGGYYYYEAVSANTDVVEASVFGMTVLLKAIDSGKTTVTVKDVLTYRTIDIPIVVNNNTLQLSETALTLLEGKQVTVDIISGSGLYSIKSSDENVAIAHISDGKITVIAVSSGTATITVSDTNSGEMTKIEVTVNAAPSICPDDHHPHMIDLGLPSGTKWACCNVGADKPEDNGKYFAWGETEEKGEYNWSNYIHRDDSFTYHTFDSDISGTQYDVAHIQWGGPWVIPPLDQIKELIDNCSSQRITMNGVNGQSFTGPNGKTIFLPAAGYGPNSSGNTGSSGYYWSSSPCSEEEAFHLYFYPNGMSYKGEYRFYGYSIRPIVKLTLSKSSLFLNIGEKVTVDIIGNGDYSFLSSDENVATAKVLGDIITLTAVGIGSATITLTDIANGQTAHITVTVYNTLCPDDNHPHVIDLGLPSGTKWACCNVEAEKPEDCGGYFAWGETVEKEVYNSESYSFFTYEYDYDGSFINLGPSISGSQYDVAHIKWGGQWQMPSTDHFKELINNCTYEWITINGINGGLFTSPNGSCIFLPASGHKGCEENDCIGNTFCDIFNNNISCEYWSGEQNTQDDYLACSVYFNKNRTQWNSFRGWGLSVRPVNNELFFLLSSSTVNFTSLDYQIVEILCGSGNYNVQSSDTNVVTAIIEEDSVIITPVSNGSATIAVFDTKSGQTATIEATVSVEPPSYFLCPDSNHPHIIDLGLPSGTKWACCNVGANKPEDFGDYYAWGETEVKSEYNDVTYQYSTGVDEDGDGWYDDHDYLNPEGILWDSWLNIGNNISKSQYDVAYIKWGDGWVIPSYDQIKELFTKCSYYWTSINDINGLCFTSSNGRTIFMPAAGSHEWGSLNGFNKYGFYWSSTLHSKYSSSANCLLIESVCPEYNCTCERYTGNSIRPVTQ